MNKDAIILSFMLAVVLAAGAVFYLYSQQDDSDDHFTPADTGANLTAAEQPQANIPTRHSNEQLNKEFGRKDPLAAQGARVVAEADVEEEEAARIGGQVVNSEGQPIADAVVALCVDVGSARNISVLGPIKVAAQTDKDGLYVIDGIPTDERYAIRVEAVGYASRIEQCVQLSGGESRKINFQLGNGATLRGLVTDLEGNPIKGATLLISDMATRSSDPDLDLEKVATTDDNGEFVCTGLNNGSKKVTCMAATFVTKTVLTVTVNADKEGDPLEFKLRPGGVSFSGRVIDADDELAVEGVIVRAQPIRTGRGNMPSMNYPPVKSDQDGVFTFTGLEPGSYRVRFFGGKGYALSGTHRTIRVPGEQDLVVKLQREPSASGQVVDGETGEPITKFRIHFARSESLVMASPQLSQKFEDEEGKFTYVGIPTTPRTMKEFYLHATAKGYAGGVSKKLVLNGREDFDGVVIQMYRGATVKGKVVDSSGKPIKNATIELAPQMGPPGGAGSAGGLFSALIANGTRTTRRHARTNEKGEFTIESVAQGWYKVEADHARYSDCTSEESLEVGREGEFTFPDLVLMKGATLKGRVLSKSGEPEKNARVRVTTKGSIAGRSYSKQTDGAGRFEIRNIRPGVYQVTVIERGGQIDLSSMLTQALNPPTEIILGDGEVQDIGDL